MSARIILIEPDADARDSLARRLRAQDYVVDCAADGITGAELALAAPPAAVVSDLWMSGVSGVQLCRLLRSEPATAEVPVVLRAERDDPRSRFWAQCAGAVTCVSRNRIGELMRVLARVAVSKEDDAFFMRFGAGTSDVRDRIARHLDEALFESVMAAETRALAGATSFPRLFDSLSQLVSQLLSYSLLAVSVVSPVNLAIHCHSSDTTAEDVARSALRVGSAVCASAIRDGDAAPLAEGPCEPIVREIRFRGTLLGRIAVVPTPEEPNAEHVVSLIARELGGPLRMTALLETSQRLATTDPLTQLANRRAFTEAASGELARADRCGEPVSLALVDIDYFKLVNDRRGHACGDAVLAKIGEVLAENTRPYDLVARWGGEEFVVAMPNVDATDAIALGERLRAAIEQAEITSPLGDTFGVTASVGLTTRCDGESLDALLERADRGMYQAKTSGRNTVRIVNGPMMALVRKDAA